MASKKILINVQVSAGAASAEVKKVEVALGKLSNAQVKVNKVTQKGRAQSGLNNAILLETGRLASDASFGFSAMANNLGQIVTLFQSFSRTNGGVIASLKELGRSIFGMGGVLIGIQLLISFGPKLIKIFQNIGSETRFLSKTFEKAGETVSSLSGKFESYISVLQNSTQSEKNKENAIKALNLEYPEFIKNLDESGTSMDDLKNSTEDANEQINIQRDAIIELAKSRAATNKIQEIQSEIINKKLIRDLDIIRAGVEGLNDEEIMFRANLLDVTSVFAKMEDVDKRNTLIRLVNERKEHEEFIKNKEQEIKILSDFLEVAEPKDKPDGEDVRNRVKSVLEIAKIEYNDFFAFLEKRTKDFDFIITKVLEGFTLKQIDQMLIARDALKGAGDAGIQALQDLVAEDDKYTKSSKGNSKTREKLDKIETKSKLQALDDIGKGLMAASQIAGKATGAGKGLAVAGTLVSTYSAAQKAYESQMVPSIDSPVRAAIAAAAAIAQGLANVKAIMSVKVAGMASSSVSGGGPTTVEAPDFNVVGAGGVSQLATTLAGVTGQPLKAFVVSKEITSAQELERNITNTASVG